MKKAFIFLSVVFIFGFSMSGCASFVNWGKRINVTLGGGLPLNDVDVSV
jgi:hypothetical protein